MLTQKDYREAETLLKESKKLGSYVPAQDFLASTFASGHVGFRRGSVMLTYPVPQEPVAFDSFMTLRPDILMKMLSQTTGVISISEDGKIKTDSGSEMSFKTTDFERGAEYIPVLPLSSESYATFDAPSLLEAITRAKAYAANPKDTNRRALTGILLESDGTLAATDSYRVIYGLPTGCEFAEGTLPGRYLIPAGALVALTKFLKVNSPGQRVELSIYDGSLSFRGVLKSGAAYRLDENLLDTGYVEYRRLIPLEDNLTDYEFDGSVLAQLKHLVKVVGHSSPTVPVAIDISQGVAKFTASNEARDLVSASFTVPVQTDGPDASVAFNPQFLIEALTSGGTRMRLQSGDEGFFRVGIRKPTVFGENVMVMPVKYPGSDS